MRDPKYLIYRLLGIVLDLVKGFRIVRRAIIRFNNIYILLASLLMVSIDLLGFLDERLLLKIHQYNIRHYRVNRNDQRLTPPPKSPFELGYIVYCTSG